jgi:hypothetical protein
MHVALAGMVPLPCRGPHEATRPRTKTPTHALPYYCIVPLKRLPTALSSPPLTAAGGASAAAREALGLGRAGAGVRVVQAVRVGAGAVDAADGGGDGALVDVWRTEHQQLNRWKGRAGAETADAGTWQAMIPPTDTSLAITHATHAITRTPSYVALLTFLPACSTCM